ncbi:extracellular solute-binding protein [Paenibacillus harenae]|uniref:Aldouronate transport system substrate-binding protein n=1 Tax=Paenibacillus harenae TaxID=306543 RepID=A0ABT9U813_PAEHA|nr:extracellular solute-binding protein [Paenibacillus harenae]MDQ0063456.1 putative aldouronate transport system substrate-binding protein [Paenibacillus harenae]MDQ0115787.1 putative aldouronate transport system substrate-binding protein [Paenibacillus harenae]
MKKTVFSMLALVLSITLILSACGKGNEENNPNNAGTTNTESGPVQMTFFAPQGKAAWEDNSYTKHVEEKFNVKIKWDLAPADALTDRRQLLLASGDYPEVFLEGKFTHTDLLTYGKQGVFLPLNDLIEKHAPNIKAMMEKKPYFKEAITATDGNIYALPRLNECYHCTFSQKFWMNKEWLDKVGLPVPKTTDELYTVLKAFKEQDPNGNGKADEIPLTGAPNKNVWNGNIDAYLMNSFIYNDNSKYLILKDGKVEFAANQEAWKQGLVYMNKLYKEGLIDPASFTQNDQAVGQLGNREGDEIVGSITTALVSYLVNPYDGKETRHKHWVIVPPLKGPDGVQLAGASQGIGDFQFALTNKASEAQQIAAIKIMDYAFGEEGALMSEYGTVEGFGWKKAEDGEKNIDGKAAKYSFFGIPEADPDLIRNDSWSLMGPKDLSKEFRDLFAVGQDPLAADGYETRLAQATNAYAPYSPAEIYPSGVFILPDDMDAASQLTTSIQDYVTSNMAQFIIGSKNIEKDWDAYVKGFDGLNLAKYLEIYGNAIKKE